MSEKPALYMTRKGRALFPMDEATFAAIGKLDEGALVTVTIRRPRNAGQFRLYWAMCGLVAANHADLHDAESVHQAIKLLAGWTDKVAMRSTGEIIFVPRSISFASMNPDEWDQYLKLAKQVVVEHLLPGMTSDALAEEVGRMAA